LGIHCDVLVTALAPEVWQSSEDLRTNAPCRGATRDVKCRESDLPKIIMAERETKSWGVEVRRLRGLARLNSRLSAEIRVSWNSLGTNFKDVGKDLFRGIVLYAGDFRGAWTEIYGRISL
jgi:hypothetical protein